MKLFRIAAALVCLAALPASAKEQRQEFTPRTNISDGKAGRAWGQFNQKLEERNITRIRMTVARRSGGEDTFLNVRFGKDGATLDGSKREHLKNEKRTELEWKVNQKPGGKPLIVNAYNGEVFLENVIVYYED